MPLYEIPAAIKWNTSTHMAVRCLSTPPKDRSEHAQNLKSSGLFFTRPIPVERRSPSCTCAHARACHIICTYFDDDPRTAFLNAVCEIYTQMFTSVHKCSQVFTNVHVDAPHCPPRPISLAVSQRHLQAHRARVTPKSALHAAALALHCLLVTEGCVCTGQDDKAGAVKGFAAPVRDIPEEKLVPTRW